MNRTISCHLHATCGVTCLQISSYTYIFIFRPGIISTSSCGWGRGICLRLLFKQKQLKKKKTNYALKEYYEIVKEARPFINILPNKCRFLLQLCISTQETISNLQSFRAIRALIASHLTFDK